MCMWLIVSGCSSFHHSGNGSWWPLLLPLLLHWSHVLNILVLCSWKAECPQGSDQINIDIYRGHSCLYTLNAMGCVGFKSCPLCHLAWRHTDLVSLLVGQVHGRDMDDCRFRHAFSEINAWRSCNGDPLALVYIMETGLMQNAPSGSLNPVLWMPSNHLMRNSTTYSNVAVLGQIYHPSHQLQ